jgi:hypothetical protein
VSRELLATVGQPYLFVPLGAPPEGAIEVMDWHAVERPGLHAFRWTRSSAVQWHVDLPPIRPCTAKFLIPLHMEVQPGFAAASRLHVDGREWQAPKVDAARLEASGVLAEENDGVVTLRTPEPIRPASRSRHPLAGPYFFLDAFLKSQDDWSYGVHGQTECPRKAPGCRCRGRAAARL